MSGFSSVERSLSSWLKGHPRLHALLKKWYQHLNYGVYGERGFQFALDNGVELTSPSQIIGAEDPVSNVAQFFGYFDASPWSPNERYYALHEVDGGQKDALITVYDFQENTRIDVDSTKAWTWQQGAMARWVEAGDHLFLIFNSIRDRTLGASIWNPALDSIRFLPFPLQAPNPPFQKYYSINYIRLHTNRTDYGYALDSNNFPRGMPEKEDGIWSVQLNDGSYSLTVSLQDLAERNPRREMSTASHEVNHISVAPDGKRFAFLHRFRNENRQYSRLYVAGHDGRELTLLLDDDMVSHYTWLSPSILLVWANTQASGPAWYTLNIESREAHPLSKDRSPPWGDGHPTHNVTSGGIAADSYPDRKRQQHLYLFESTGIRSVARFYLPVRYAGSRRIDLHPRWSPSGRELSIDAGFSGQRRNYIIRLAGNTDPPSEAFR